MEDKEPTMRRIRRLLLLLWLRPSLVSGFAIAVAVLLPQKSDPHDPFISDIITAAIISVVGRSSYIHRRSIPYTKFSLLNCFFLHNFLISFSLSVSVSVSLLLKQNGAPER